MNLKRRLSALENQLEHMPPLFLPYGSPIGDSLSYSGIQGGLRFDREPDETSEQFEQRCRHYDRKHRQKNFIGIFFCRRRL